MAVQMDMLSHPTDTEIRQVETPLGFYSDLSRHDCLGNIQSCRNHGTGRWLHSRKMSDGLLSDIRGHAASELVVHPDEVAVGPYPPFKPSAVNGRFEPKLTDAARRANVCCWPDLSGALCHGMNEAIQCSVRVAMDVRAYSF